MNTVSKTVKKQQVIKQVEGFRIDGGAGRLKIKIRFDDCCGNGHNTFAITADLYRDDRHWAGGCLHDEIREFAPEYAYLIKWHHRNAGDNNATAIANALYHIRDTDHNGLKAGEYSAYIKKIVSNAITEDETEVVLYESKTWYSNKQNNPNLDASNIRLLEQLEQFRAKLTVDHRVVDEPQEYSKSEGKPVELEASRNSCYWPNATKEQLQDRDHIEQHIKDSLVDFIADLNKLGMEY